MRFIFPQQFDHPPQRQCHHMRLQWQPLCPRTVHLIRYASCGSALLSGTYLTPPDLLRSPRLPQRAVSRENLALLSSSATRLQFMSTHVLVSVKSEK